MSWLSKTGQGVLLDLHISTAAEGYLSRRRILVEPTIVRVAVELGYDTIVIASRRLGPLHRVLLGSLSGYVTHNAPATVIIAR